MIVIGLDPHSCSHAPVAIDPAGTIVGRLKVTADKTPATGCWPGYGHGPSGGGLSRAPKGLGHLVAQHLVAAGEPVFDVRAKLAARARLLEKRHGRKTDKLDAVSIALVAQRRTDLQPVAIEDHTALLRLPSDRRDDSQRKIADAKTSAEALLCLKRQLAKVLYRQLSDNHQLHLAHAA